MGTVGSKDARRISFDNTFALNTALVDQKSIEDDNILSLDTITAVTIEEKNEDIFFPESTKVLEVEKEGVEVEYWSNRIDQLKKEHRLINKIIETEYEKTLEDKIKLLEKSEVLTKKYDKVKPCFEWRDKIMQCYEENSHQPLVCSPIVQAFTKCVTSCKVQE